LDDLAGSFSVVRLDASGEGWVGADPFGTGLVYIAPAPGFIAVSNNAAVAAGAAQGTCDPARAVESLAWLPFFAIVLDQGTSFSGVEVLGPGARIEVGGSGWRRTPDRPLWASMERVGPDAIDRLAEQVVARVEAIARFPVRRRELSLSGGRDSRLVVAAVAAAGLLDRFILRTRHSPDGSADEIVARLVGEALGVEVKTARFGGGVPDSEAFETRLRHHVYQTWGMHGAWDLMGVVRRSPDLRVSGLFGETLRSHYAGHRRFDSAEDARRFFAFEMPFDRAGILRPEVVAELRQRVAAWVDQRLDDGVPFSDLADIFYAENRLRRWQGTVRHVQLHNPVADPLQTARGFRIALALGHELRRVDAIPFELIRTLYEPLARVPLAVKAWHPAAIAATPDPALYDVPAVAGGSAIRWREFSTMAPVFAAELLHESGSPLLDLLDRDRVAAAIEGRRRLDAYGKTALWATLAAAVWLDRAELPIRYPRRRLGAAVATGKEDRAVLIVDTGHGDSDVDQELRHLCDDLLARCDASLFDHPADLVARMAALDDSDLCDRARRLVADRGGLLRDPRLALTGPFWQRVAVRVGMVLVIGESGSSAMPAARATALQVAAIRSGVPLQVAATDGVADAVVATKAEPIPASLGDALLVAPAHVVAGVSAALAAVESGQTQPIRRGTSARCYSTGSPPGPVPVGDDEAKVRLERLLRRRSVRAALAASRAAAPVIQWWRDLKRR
jgi:hypothetical protein